jgi:hypothetical protein
MLKRSILLVILALCCLAPTLTAAQIPTFDPTSPAHVEILQKCMRSSLDKLAAFPKPLGADYCWDYDASNYWPSEECSYSPDADCNTCLQQEQACVNECDRRCARNPDGSVNNNNGSCFENCGDPCRQERDACWAAHKCKG